MLSIVANRHVSLTKELSEAGSAGAEGELVLRTRLRTAQVRRDGNASSVLKEVFDGRHRGTDTCTLTGSLNSLN